MQSLLQDHLSVRSPELPDSNCSREARTNTPLPGGLVTRGGFLPWGSLDVQPAKYRAIPAASELAQCAAMGRAIHTIRPPTLSPDHDTMTPRSKFRRQQRRNRNSTGICRDRECGICVQPKL